jgi:predicted amidohydrolase
MQAGAYQNACWVVGAAKAGNEDGFELMAGTCIVNPDGEIVALAETAEDELIIFDCDFDECAFLKRTTFDFAAHRRIEHYKRICSQTGMEPPPQ